MLVMYSPVTSQIRLLLLLLAAVLMAQLALLLSMEFTVRMSVMPQHQQAQLRRLRHRCVNTTDICNLHLMSM
jgi:hypothetical protein